MTRKLFQKADVRWVLAASLMGATAGTLAQAPLAPTPMVQVPIATTYAGVPAATYSSATSGGSCPSTTPGYLSGNQGCPASQETFYYPYGVGIDASNNITVATYGSGQNNTSGVSLIYQGGATMAALITAALPRFTFTPMAGHVYQLANGTQLTLNTTTNGYYCTGSTTGIQSQDQWGDGCPAEYAASQSRYVTMDSQGNIFFSQVYGSGTDYQGLKVIYAGGTAVANLITSYFNAHCANWPTGEVASVVTTGNVCALGITPKVGYVYSLSAPNDFVAIRGIGVQVNPVIGGETIYASDNGASTPETGLGAATSGNQIKVFTGTGWATYILGNTTGSASAVQGDGGPATSAFVDLPSAIATDASGDLFLLDSTDARIRVVYNGGTTPPLYINGTSSYVTNPVVGNIYTVVGGAGTQRVSPTPSYKLSTGSPGPFGVDPQGNLYFLDSSKLTWVINAVTGMAVNIAGGSANSASGSTSLAPGAGVACNGSTSPVTGPLMTDAYADGCPATEVATLNGIGAIVFDTAGNYYMAEGRVTSGATGIVRKYSYNNNFGTVAAGSPQTNLLAFTPYVRTSTYTPTATYSMTGAATSEYIDAGGANCYTSTTPNVVETCTYNATFAPAAAGERPGSLKLSAAGSTLASIPLSGNGGGAQIALDPATVTTLGTASTYSPTGVAVDQSGDAFMADGTTNNIFESVAGGTPVLYATGFSKPAQLAVSGSGTLFVADSGNNRIAMVAAGTPAVVTPFISGLNQPAGVAVDAQGDLFIADTGNNRVLEVPYDLGTYGKTVVLGFTGLSSPLGLAVDTAGDVFVADNGNGRVVELSVTGVQTAISMNPAAVKPVGVALDPAGDLFVADATNQTITVVPFGTTTATAVSGSVVGLNGLAADNFGDLYATASSVSGVIAINRTQITLTYPQTNIGKSNTQTFTMTNSGNQPLSYGSSLSSSTDTVDYSVVPATTNGCSASSSLAVGANCGIAGVFQPQSVSPALVDVVSFPGSNAVGGAKATLTGPGQMGLGYMFGTPGTLPNTINVLITATLAVPAPATPINGTVTFNVGGTITTVPVSGGTAVLNTPLSAGTYVVVATYNGTTYPGSVTQL